MNLRDLERVAELRRLIVSGEAKALRLSAGISSSEVAGPCDVDASTVWRWEEGIRIPRGSTALRYAQVLAMLERVASTSGRDQAPLALEELRTWIFATRSDIAAVLKTDVRTIGRAIESGVIPAVRISDSTIRIPVQPFLKACGFEPEDGEALAGNPGARHDISHQLPDRHPHDHPPPA